MNFIRYTNISLELFGCFMSGVVTFCIFLSKNSSSKCSKLYLQMLLFNTGILLFDAIAYLTKGHSGTFFWISVRLSNFISFMCDYLLMISFVCYLTEYIGERIKVSKLPVIISRVVCLIGIGLVVLTQFVPVIYTIDSSNLYHRANGFWISQGIVLICFFLCALTLIKHKTALEPQERVVFWFYIISPSVALVIQMFLYGLVILNIVNTILLVVVFLFTQAKQGQRIAEQEYSLMQSRTAIMLSQIQPHFLYNSLSVISYLCESDPKQAQKAVNHFSDYLRGNMDSLKRTTPVTFDTELKHVKNYLYIEKIRYEDELNIIYNIETTNFMLPALTIQPLVENAVKYGVGKKPGGGTVTISTKENDKYYQIIITDDGVGYDPSIVQDDGRTHNGIENVRSRLETMVKGTLTIKGTKNIGTITIIELPKENNI